MDCYAKEDSEFRAKPVKAAALAPGGQFLFAYACLPNKLD
jgi:hypothetical protein